MNKRRKFGSMSPKSNLREKEISGGLFWSVMWIRFWTKPGSRSLYLKRRRVLKFYTINTLDNFKPLLFRFILLVSSVSPRALDPDPYQGCFSGSRTSMERLTSKVCKQKRNASEIVSFFEVRAPDPVFLAKPGSTSLKRCI